MHKLTVRVSIVVSIPACHAGDRGSIPRHGEFFFQYTLTGLQSPNLFADMTNIFYLTKRTHLFKLSNIKELKS